MHKTSNGGLRNIAQKDLRILALCPVGVHMVRTQQAVRQPVEGADPHTALASAHLGIFCPYSDRLRADTIGYYRSDLR